jgi:hypothetical protein
MNLGPWEPWAIAGCASVAMFIVGQKRTVGWAATVLVQLALGVYGTLSHQYGFWVQTVLCGGMAVRNWVRWWRLSRTNAQPRGAGHGQDVR